MSNEIAPTSEERRINLLSFIEAFRTNAVYSPHARIVAAGSLELGRELEISENQLPKLFLAALLHDLGKVGESGEICEKPRWLNQIEITEVSKHPEAGAELIKNAFDLPQYWYIFRCFFREVAEIVLHHHENWNGTGYPGKLAGEKISIESHIIKATDACNAMLNRDHRISNGKQECHKRTKPEAIAELEEKAGIEFDPKVVEALVRILKRQSPWFAKTSQNC